MLREDYLDRGRHSRAVVEHLCRPATAGHTRIALRSNRQEAFRRLLEKPEVFPEWSRFAGPETLGPIDIHCIQIVIAARWMNSVKWIVRRW